jgi:hypothetical protein
MMLWRCLKHKLKLDDGQRAEHEGAHLAETRVNLRQLEESQAPLKQALRDSGFFLGDALTIQRQREQRPQ